MGGFAHPFWMDKRSHYQIISGEESVKLYLWLLSQEDNNGYETFDSCVVVAPTEEEAKLITPCYSFSDMGDCKQWANSPDGVKVKLIGEAIGQKSGEVILASFNAG